MNVARLSSGVEEHYWTWHGKNIVRRVVIHTYDASSSRLLSCYGVTCMAVGRDTALRLNVHI